MTPLTASSRSLFGYAATCMVLAIMLATVLVNAGLATWVAALLYSAPLCLVLGFVLASAYYVCRSAGYAQRGGFPTVATFGAAAMCAGACWTLLAIGWNEWGAALATSVGADPMAQLVAVPPGFWLLLLVLGSGLYLVSLLLHDVWMTTEQLRTAQSRAAQSLAQAREAQLQVLRTQINPHFLFNSLNSISALTSHNAAAARAMTLELAAFFRQTLAVAEKEWITVAEELALCEHFLAVEKIRFGDKLQTRVEVSQAAQAVPIPPLLLQPCVENAVKHGVRHVAGGGCIELQAFVQASWLYITIINPIDPDSPASEGTGTGLANIQQRLAAAYGERARVQWARNQDRFSLEIVLPTEAVH